MFDSLYGLFSRHDSKWDITIEKDDTQYLVRAERKVWQDGTMNVHYEAIDSNRRGPRNFEKYDCDKIALMDARLAA